MLAKEYYQGREQAAVKHYVLEKYLERLVYKLGHIRKGITLNYVDGFSGPWNQHASDYSDTSPWIAMKQLDQVRANLDAQGHRVIVRCLFIEKDADAYEKLKRLPLEFPALEAITLPGRFEERVGDVVKFARVGRDPFAFVLIDPTGWTGYGLQAITPLLQVE
jgi:three-Cys-motif partner protein